MSRLQAFGRWTALLLAFCLFLAVPGWIVARLPGIYAGAIGGAVIVLAIGAFSERFIHRKLHASATAPSGLAKTLAGSASRLNPRILLVPDPAPNLVIARGLFGPGSLLLSQGLIALLSEEELRAVIGVALGRLEAPGIRLQTVCSVLLSWIFALMPTTWVALVYSGRQLKKGEEAQLTPASAYLFFLLFPAARFFLGLSGTNRESFGLGGDRAAGDALRKILGATGIWTPTQAPGAFHLYLVNPLAGRSLLPV